MELGRGLHIMAAMVVNDGVVSHCAGWMLFSLHMYIPLFRIPIHTEQNTERPPADDDIAPHAS